MGLRRWLEILHLIRSPARIESETQSLMPAEAKIETRELNLCSQAIQEFEHIQDIAHYTNNLAKTNEWIAVNTRDLDEFDSALNDLQKILLELRACSENILAVKERIESNLLKTRKGRKDRRHSSLTQTEGRLIEYIEEIEQHVEYTIQQVKFFSEQDISGLENVKKASYLEPKDQNPMAWA